MRVLLYSSICIHSLFHIHHEYVELIPDDDFFHLSAPLIRDTNVDATASV